MIWRVRPGEQIGRYEHLPRTTLERAIWPYFLADRAATLAI